MPSSHDITIYWADKPAYNRHKVAIEIQDAGNLRAIAREFVKVVDSAMDATGSTKATWDDPAVVLLVNKLESLCRSEERFSAAYKLCQELAASKLNIELATDHHEGEQFRDWLIAQGHKAKLGATTQNKVDGVSTWNEDASNTLERLWNGYCNQREK